MREQVWFEPSRLAASAFIASTLQPKTPRVALIFEICRAKGIQPRLSKQQLITHLKKNWFTTFESNRAEVTKYSRSGSDLPEYFVNYAVSGRRLPEDDPFFTRSHLGGVNEKVENAISQRFFPSYANGYSLLPKPTSQGELNFSIIGNMACLLAEFHPEFSFDLYSSNPLEGKCVHGLALHAIISYDFGFAYHLTKQITANYPADSPIKLQSQIGRITHLCLAELIDSFRTARDPKKAQWLRERNRILLSRQRDFEKQDYCTAANDLVMQRCQMLMDAGLIETSNYGNWEFRNFEACIRVLSGCF